MYSQIRFVAFVTPQPQGSMRGFVRNGRAILTSDNAKLKPCRSELTRVAIEAMRSAGIELPFAGKHVPVSLALDFYVRRPQSSPRKRAHPSVKPDIDKLARMALDAMTGSIYADDGQVVAVTMRKHYGDVERIEVSASIA